MEIMFAERFKKLMKQKHLTQVKLAEVVGVSQSTISKWLLKKREPDFATAWLLADYFGVTVDFLIGRKEY